MRGQAILSIHDVFPATFSRVEKIISLLEECGVPPATLLVVPGREWSEERLADLRRMAEKGHPLAGHGWVHKAVPTSRTLFHKFHAALISRNEAEHLSRPPDELREMIERCYEWFPSVGLPAPELYVPPAWALGSLDLGKLKDLPFRWYEILRGFVEGETGQTRWLPLAGFEADTTFRQVSLRLWNGLNGLWGKRLTGPLRISIHPGDLDLLLEKDLKRMVGGPWEFIRETQIFGAPSGAEAS
jgi:predicted deacetylase